VAVDLLKAAVRAEALPKAAVRKAVPRMAASEEAAFRGVAGGNRAGAAG